MVVDGAAFTPGPLTNFDVEGSSPGVPIFRLSVPAQMTTPFAVGEPPPDPADGRRAGGRGRGRWAHHRDGRVRPGGPPIEQFVELLPAGYELTDQKVIHGLFDLQALVYERTGAEG